MVGVLTRSASLVGILLGLSLVVFLLEAVVPADPVLAMVGASATPQIVEAKRDELGLDRRCPPARLVRGSASPGCRCREASAAPATT
jgi:ABC-type dipeptide/oligopeptide/nickel transport system permease component